MMNLDALRREARDHNVACLEEVELLNACALGHLVGGPIGEQVMGVDEKKIPFPQGQWMTELETLHAYAVEGKRIRDEVWLDEPLYDVWLVKHMKGTFMPLHRDLMSMADGRYLLDDDGAYREAKTPGVPDRGYLTLQEVGLLADMELRSVATATAPKAPDRLITESFGKLSLVPVAEARRWLPRRKGFVPTTDMRGKSRQASRTAAVELPVAVVRSLEARAKAAGMSLAKFLASIK